MDPLAASSERVQRFEGKINICKGKQLSVPERAGITSFLGEKTTKLKIALDNVSSVCVTRVTSLLVLSYTRDK